MKKKVKIKYDLGGLIDFLGQMNPEDLELYKQLHPSGSKIVDRKEEAIPRGERPFMRDVFGDSLSTDTPPGQTPIQGVTAAPQDDRWTPMPKDNSSSNIAKKGSGISPINLNTLPALQGLDALVTQFVTNPQTRASEARKLRNQLMPVTSASNFYGNDDMGMYAADGGYVTSMRKQHNMTITEETPSTGTSFIKEHIDPLTSRPITSITAAHKIVPNNTKSVSWERLLNREGTPINYSPVFNGDWAPNDMSQFLSQAPSRIDNLPVVPYKEYSEEFMGDGGKVAPYHTTDPNDPRIQLYKDSLNQHNNFIIRNRKVNEQKNVPDLNQRDRNMQEFYGSDAQSGIENVWLRRPNWMTGVIRGSEVQIGPDTYQPLNWFPAPKQDVYLDDRAPVAKQNVPMSKRNYVDKMSPLSNVRTSLSTPASIQMPSQVSMIDYKSDHMEEYQDHFNKMTQTGTKKMRYSKGGNVGYETWKAKLPKALQYEGDYDLRGLYNSNPNVVPSANMHFPDTYKLPNHPTFSNESIYYDGTTPGVGGYWSGDEYIKNPKIGPPVPGMYAKGGETGANVEAEGGEFMMLPDGKALPITGPSHEEGGVDLNLPGGTRIYSDRIKAEKDFASELLNKDVTTKMSISKIAKRFDTSKEDKILKMTNKDPIAQRTANIMKAAKEAKLNELFDYQEYQKDPAYFQTKFAKGGTVADKFKNLLNSTGELAPELLGLVQGLTDFPIHTAKYQPSYLSQAPQLNIQGALNRSSALAKPLMDQTTGDASIDNARALQALSLTQDNDSQAFSQKYNIDSQARFQVNNTNVGIENQANLTNLDRADKFWEKATARQAAKESTLQNVANSAYSKMKAKEYEKRSLDLVSQMLPNYKYDPGTGLQFVYDEKGNIIHMPNTYQTSGLYNNDDNIRTRITKMPNGATKQTLTEDPRY